MLNTFSMSSDGIVLQPFDGKDTYIRSFYFPAGGQGEDTDTLLVGGWGDYYYSFLQFDLQGQPSEVDSVTLRLYVYEQPAPPWSYPEMSLWTVHGSWFEGMQWPQNTTNATFVRDVGRPESIGWFDIDITGIYTQWQSGALANDGIQLRPLTNVANQTYIVSSEAADAEHRPMLVIDPTDKLLNGGNGNDHLLGGYGHDTLSGGNGDDMLAGRMGNDHLTGGNGKDTLEGGAGCDLLSGGNGNDILRGEAGGDQLEGGNGSDLLSGGDGDDLLDSGNGADSLEGGAGTDCLKGGNGPDSFIFRSGFGNDTITDFRTAGSQHDVLQFDSLFADLADLFAHSVDTANGTLITTTAGDTLLVKDVTLAQLQAHPEDVHFI